MPTQNKTSVEPSKTRSYDWIYLALGALVMVGLILALVGGPEPVDFAGAQQDAPSSPGGGALALPPITRQEPDSEPAPETTPDTGTATNVPTPESPVIEIEEIDEAGETEVIPVPVDEEFNLEADVDTARPTQSTPTQSPRQPTATPAPTTTVRSGGIAVWLTVAVVLLAAGGVYYYQTKGNRKASLKMGEKKGKMK